MSEKKQPTFAANNQQIARALDLHTSRRQLAEIGEWRQRPDFPKMERDGFLIADLQDWHAEFLKQPPLFSPEEAAAQYERSFIRLFLSGKKPVESCKPSERKILQKHGLLPPREEGEITDGEISDLGFSTNQTGLTEAMARHFGQKFGFIISENKVSQLLQGKGIPPGAVSPPTKIRGRFNNSSWAKWLETTFGRNGNSNDPQNQLLQDDYRRMDTAQIAKAEYDAGLARIKYQTAEKRHILVDVARNTRRGMLKLALAKVQRIFEHDDTLKRAEWLRPKLSPTELQEFREFDQALARAGVDTMIADFQKGIAADPESEQARELSEG